MAIIAERKFAREIELTADWSFQLKSFKLACEHLGLRVEICQNDTRYGVLYIPEGHWTLESLDRNGLTVGSKWNLNKANYENR